jgi:hypothetical protein
MIHRSISKIAAAFIAVAFLGTAQAAKPTLKQQTESTAAAAAKDPDKAADIVGAKVAETPEYACAIIKAALGGAKLAKEEAPALIAAALKAAPEKAPEIKACLPADMAGGGTGEPGDGTDTTEEIVPGSGVLGAYLAAPSGGGSIGNGGGEEAPTIKTVVKPVVKIIKRNVSGPGTRS